MVQSGLLRLDAIVGRINTHPEYATRVRREADYGILEEAAKHSALIEIEHQTLGSTESLRAKPEMLQHMREAWDYLARDGISITALASLGHFLEPVRNPHRNFRLEEVTIGRVPPSQKEHVPYHVQSLIARLAEFPLHAVYRAVEAHLEMARIHPYMDGNGRAARLLQNFCLLERGYPAAIVPAIERQRYIELLQSTLQDREERKSTYEKPSTAEELFRMFTVTKVIEAAKRVEQVLKSRRQFAIELTGIKDRGMLIGLSRKIHNYARHQGRGIETHLGNQVKRRKQQMSVIGDISKPELDRLTAEYAKGCGFRYQVTPQP